jgi:uncharacterized membrane protein
MQMMQGRWGLIMVLLLVGGWAGVVAALVALLVGLVMTNTLRRPRPLAPPDSALEILHQRYARGELSPQEFETIRRDLTAGGHG